MLIREKKGQLEIVKSVFKMGDLPGPDGKFSPGAYEDVVVATIDKMATTIPDTVKAELVPAEVAELEKRLARERLGSSLVELDKCRANLHLLKAQLEDLQKAELLGLIPADLAASLSELAAEVSKLAVGKKPRAKKAAPAATKKAAPKAA